MSDGISQPENYAPLLAKLRQARISRSRRWRSDPMPIRKLLGQIAAAHRRPRLRDRQRARVAEDLCQGDPSWPQSRSAFAVGWG